MQIKLLCERAAQLFIIVHKEDCFLANHFDLQSGVRHHLGALPEIFTRVCNNLSITILGAGL
jgi:hypothetical protein